MFGFNSCMIKPVSFFDTKNISIPAHKQAFRLPSMQLNCDVVSFTAAKPFEPIKFEEAQTLREAVYYAHEKFDVDCFSVSLKDERYDLPFKEGDLEILNYINEALTEAYNRTKGKIKLPALIALDENLTVQGEVVHAAMFPKITELKGKTRLSAGMLFARDNIDSFKKELRDRIGYFVQNKLFTSDDEKCTLVPQFSNSADFDNKAKKIGDFFVNSDNAKLKDVLELLYFSESVDKSLMVALKNGLSANAKVKINIPKTSAFDLIFHELGHLQHADCMGYFPFMTLKTKNIVQEFVNNPKKQMLASNVRDYSNKSPIEFVADVYAGLLNGWEFSEGVMKLYKEYGGPIPEVHLAIQP